MFTKHYTCVTLTYIKLKSLSTVHYVEILTMTGLGEVTIGSSVRSRGEVNSSVGTRTINKVHELPSTTII